MDITIYTFLYFLGLNCWNFFLVVNNLSSSLLCANSAFFLSASDQEWTRRTAGTTGRLHGTGETAKTTRVLPHHHVDRVLLLPSLHPDSLPHNKTVISGPALEQTCITRRINTSNRSTPSITLDKKTSCSWTSVGAFSSFMTWLRSAPTRSTLPGTSRTKHRPRHSKGTTGSRVGTRREVQQSRLGIRIGTEQDRIGMKVRIEVGIGLG